MKQRGCVRPRRPASARRSGFPPPSVTLPELLAGGSDRCFRRFVDGLVRFGVQIQAVRGSLAQHVGVSLPQYNILMVLARIAESEGGRMVDIARALDVTLPFVTGQVARLERAGLIRRRRNPGDGRSVFISLSPRGRGAMLRASPFIQQINDSLFQSLSRREMVSTTHLIERLLVHGEATLRMGRRRQR